MLQNYKKSGSQVAHKWFQISNHTTMCSNHFEMSILWHHQYNHCRITCINGTHVTLWRRMFVMVLSIQSYMYDPRNTSKNVFYNFPVILNRTFQNHFKLLKACFLGTTYIVMSLSGLNIHYYVPRSLHILNVKTMTWFIDKKYKLAFLTFWCKI